MVIYVQEGGLYRLTGCPVQVLVRDSISLCELRLCSPALQIYSSIEEDDYMFTSAIGIWTKNNFFLGWFLVLCDS